MSRYSLTAQLELASASAAQVVAALRGDAARVDLAGTPLGCLSYLLARAAEPGRPVLVVTSDAKRAQRLEADLRFFAGGERVLSYPGADTTPFVDVAPDRRAAMERLSCLSQLAEGVPRSLIVAPLGVVLRRVPPRAALQDRSARVRVGEELDREHFLRTLGEGGYLRVPLVEDPGSFAVRGGLIDVFCPRQERPVRIDLDGDEVASLRVFDPDDQRTQHEVEELAIHPVREILLGPEELARARERVGDLCDERNLPTSRRRQLVDDLSSGRSFIGLECFLPAFYARLETLFDYLPAETRVVVDDPHALARAFDAEMARARRDREAKLENKAPVFALDDLYLSEDELLGALRARPLAVSHRLLVLGGDPQGSAEDSDEDPSESLGELQTLRGGEALRLAAEDQVPLQRELSARRERDGDPFAPLVRRLRGWLDEGVRAVLCARSRVQAERLGSLLRADGLPVGEIHEGFAVTASAGESPATVALCVGSLEDGFVLPSEALACIAEEEIFGRRRSARGEKKQKASKRAQARAFVADLRELHVGDYVVHIDHGVGRYRGLSYTEVPVSRYEALQGQVPRRMEVLDLEYAGGDKLYLPVTRLNQIEKYAGAESHTPKLDKLGGYTFTRTKARVRAAVVELADELLRLYAARAARERPPLPPADRVYAQFEARFPYEETPDQGRAIDEVMSDLQDGRPMDRVVCGDVGFGKTEVALRAAFRVAMNGRQVAVLCPTTVLAQQHLFTFRERLRDYPLRVEMLSRFVPKKEQNAVVGRLKDGSADIVIGTHRLLSKDVHFASLGLLVIDEEQRFGVAHKERLKKLKTEVDVLTLSATPIPRTLHMAIGGLRELSLIATPPVDRRAIRTFVTRWDDHVVREAITRELSRGGQIFFVHNRIEGLYERAQRLQELVPAARIAVAHGRLREGALERLMSGFVSGDYDILCSTAIIENGLDIARANTMLIDRADRFGLSQLYQLRGRIGRSSERAYCYLIAPSPSQMSDEARTRIEALERFSQLGSGFQIASLDMELRGAGDLLGQEQSGNVSAVGFDLFVHMLEEAVAELRGEPVVHEIDPELTLDVTHYLPEDYVPDVGLRLSFYKRFAAADDEDAIADLAAELEDRFGRPPEPAVALARAMSLKPGLRRLRAFGCEASATRVTLHLKEDTPLDPAKLAGEVARSGWQLTPDMKLTCRFKPKPGVDAIDCVQSVLRTLQPLRA